jgi:glycosyltransferase involved in cell wall biosynthesis
MLTVLNVAYPLAPVGLDVVGGAEQTIGLIDEALVAAGHRSLVLALEGSRVRGELRPVPSEKGPLDAASVNRARRRHADALADLVARERIDVVHMHGFDFDHYLPPPGPPALATLHCPRTWYGDAALRPERPRTWLNPVSACQAAGLEQTEQMLQPIEHGVSLGAPGGTKRRSYALVLSRIAPEKGVHIALRAAHAAGLPMIVAGQLFPYPDHISYFEREITPLLDTLRRFIGPASGDRKRGLLAGARCVAVPSLVDETCSLAAREALAAGTPVVAFPAGALAHTIDHGVTGFLVRDVQTMARGMVDAASLDREACRRTAVERWPIGRMLDSYLSLYTRLAAGAP